MRTNSASESPPNFRSASDASTSAVIVSATTPAAGTAVTSVRSLNDTDSSLVSVSTVFNTGRLSVASGFIDTRATSRSPVVMPPSMPPARDDSRRYSPRFGVPGDRVVRDAAPAAGDRDALADLDRLHRLDAHQRLREQAVDAAVPVHV